LKLAESEKWSKKGKEREREKRKEKEPQSGPRLLLHVTGAKIRKESVIQPWIEWASTHRTSKTANVYFYPKKSSQIREQKQTSTHPMFLRE
jgi:hypothetical protein